MPTLTLPSRQPIRKGDLRCVVTLIGLQAEPRIALIVRTFGYNQQCSEIMIAHERVDLANSDDIIVHPKGSLFPNGLVIQTRLRGTVWNLQVTALLGHLPDDLLDDIAGVTASSEAESAIVRTGKPLDQSDDARRDFQLSELKALWSLTADYTDALLDDGIPWRIDPALLVPLLLKKSEHPPTILAEVMHILQTRHVIATFADLRVLEEAGIFNPKTWISTAYGYEIASVIATGVQAFIDSALGPVSNGPSHNSHASRPIKTPGRLSDIGDLHVQSHSRLVTAPFLWEDGGDQLLNSDLGDDCDLEVMMLATPALPG